MDQDKFLALENILRKIMQKVPIEWKKHMELGFSRTEALVLYKLNKDGQQRASQLAYNLSITTGGLTGVTDKLVQDGYICRKRDTKDRRVVYLTIAEKGKEALDTMISARKSFIATLFDGVTDAEVDELRVILDKISVNLERAENEQHE